MDIKDLNKSQLILLTLLISFVVSIATGIVTVSLMQKVPLTATQTINKVIRQTIEKVSSPDTSVKNDINNIPTGNLSALIYIKGQAQIIKEGDITTKVNSPIAEGVVISDTGIVMVDSSYLSSETNFDIKLNNEIFHATILKKFENGFTLLKIGTEEKLDSKENIEKTQTEDSTKTN